MVEQNMDVDPAENGASGANSEQQSQDELKDYEKIVENQMQLTGNVTINDFTLL